MNTQTNIWPAVIAALSAFLALIFSIFVYCQSRRLLKPKERPIISIPNLKAKFKLNEEKNIVDFILSFVYQNIGEHPANNLRIRASFCKKGDEPSLKQYMDVTCANRIDTNQKFGHPQTISQPLKIDGEKKTTALIEVYLYVLVTYKDALTNKDYKDPFYLIYKSGEAQASHATQQVKVLMEPYVQMLYKNTEN